MAFGINPAAIAQLPTTLGAMAARAVAQQLSGAQVQKVQQLLQLGDFIGGLLSMEDASGTAQPLLGGMTLADARDIHQQLKDAQLARKSLWFIRVTDHNPPPIGYLADGSAGGFFNLFATEVSYGPSTITSEKVPLGSAMMDRITGSEGVELTLTTMDDSKGTLKRWFDAKHAQAVPMDGTFGLPSEYWVDIEVFHATPQPNPDAYKFKGRMRTATTQHELSRREQAMQEVQMTFSQVDTFIPL